MYDFSMFRTREADLIRAVEHRRLIREAEAGKARRKARTSGHEADTEAPADEDAEGPAHDSTGPHGSSFKRAA
ncbi:hypothetical protein [Streptomyces odontomachi]|uniref:hypothetical protein n=1 Tax=Streptomyces odontomachi TaxID=2944940 RepID=UPI00210985CD|nr:hypothetical protein [Streptomyces sp. ODS25]